MTRVLLSGGSGFIAAHILDYLIKGGHSVVVTVRSQAKIDKIKSAYPMIPVSQLDFAIVEDIAQEGAFDEAAKSSVPFEAVIHTASPFHFNAIKVKADLLDPAINGTIGILKATKRNAPMVKRVVITSSFAAMFNPLDPLAVGHTYSEKDWNPVTMEMAIASPRHGYFASKTFAEKAAWTFCEDEKPKFSIAVINPPLVFGPIIHYINSLDAINTSNQIIRDMILGKIRDKVPPSGTFLWVDVRDVALAHIKAMEKPEAGGQRFFLAAGYFSNKKIAEIIRKAYPGLEDKLPSKNIEDDFPPQIFAIDHSRSEQILGIKYRSFEATITDTVRSLQDIST